MIPDLYRSTEGIRDYANAVMLTSFTTTAFVAAAGNKFYHGHLTGGIVFTLMAVVDGVGVYLCQRELRTELKKIDDFYSEITDKIIAESSKIHPGSFEDILLRLTADKPDLRK